MKTILGFIFTLCACSLFGQSPAFSISVDRDTVGVEETFQLTYTFENIEITSMATPSIKGFEVVGNGSTTTSISFINGTKSSSSSFSYYLKPNRKGKYTIGEEIDGNTSNELTIWVVEGKGETLKNNLDARNSQFDFFEDFEFPSFKDHFEWRGLEDYSIEEVLPEEPEKEHDAPVYQL